MSSDTMHFQGLAHPHPSARDDTASPPRRSRPRAVATADATVTMAGARGRRTRERSLLRDPAVWAWLIVAMLAMIPAGAALRVIAG